MARTEKLRGPRELRVPDWPFGSKGRRLFLEAILLDKPPAKGWTKSELERRVGVERGGIDPLLAGARDMGLVTFQRPRWYPVQPAPQIAAPLKKLVEISRSVPDRDIRPLPKRPYRRQSS